MAFILGAEFAADRRRPPPLLRSRLCFGAQRFIPLLPAPAEMPARPARRPSRARPTDDAAEFRVLSGVKADAAETASDTGRARRIAWPAVLSLSH
ncbi:hypothetical protein [Rhodopseudomonas palustris]|uniref:hypothetical protein n=1 Tax=Rhodopseudomonas palustris TaxID=1076 RepID=UPI0010578FA5|nr:hypothetical protein [Rhodopseudomonas palustris]